MMSLRSILSLTPASKRNSQRRRGVALLLVLVALGVGTILAASTLSSRENSTAIGANARDYAAAAWSAQAGVELAMAILETSVDWVELSGGDLLSDVPIGGGTANVTITNVAGLAPTDADRELIVTVVATVGEMTAIAHKRVSVVPAGPITNSISPYLDEFAAFATASLDIEDNAHLKPTRYSPETNSLYPVKIGAGFSALGNLNLGAGVQASRVSVYVDANASAALISGAGANARFGMGGALPLRVPAYPVRLPSEVTSLPLRNLGLPVDVADGAKAPGVPDLTLSAHGRYGDVEIAANATLRVDQSNGEYYEFKSLRVREGGELQIAGKVTIHVKGAMELRSGSMVDLATSDSAVRFLTSDDVKVESATFALAGEFPSLPRQPGAIASFLNPARVRLNSVDPASGGKATPTIEFLQNSVVLACIHAPNANIELKDNSFVVGRVTARALRVRSGSGIYYEPMLDSRTGYSATYGPMYEHGAPLPDVVTTLGAYVPGEGAESMHSRVVTKAKQKWDAQPGDAWFSDTTLTTNLDPFVDAVLVDTVEELGKLVGGLAGGLLGGSTAPPPEPTEPQVAPEAPTAPSQRYAGKVFSAPMTLAVRRLED